VSFLRLSRQRSYRVTEENIDGLWIDPLLTFGVRSAEAIVYWPSMHPRCNRGYFVFSEALVNRDKLDGDILRRSSSCSI